MLDQSTAKEMERKYICALCISLVSIISCRTNDTPVNDEPARFDPEEIGKVEFPISCEKVQEQMQYGLALLHHMMYTEADMVFKSVIDQDPSCAMGYWGRAMCLIHPMWPDIPSETQLDEGLLFVNQALALNPNTERERLYIEAVGAYFREAKQKSTQDRLISFHEGWQKVYQQFPDDSEASAFYALTNLTMVQFAIGDVAEQKLLALELMKKLLERIPDHPGGHHYTIHAYDYIQPDSRAVDVAKSYGELTPEVPHALHMPTHVFNNLGLWEESIELNTRSAEAAYRQGRKNEGLDIHYPHALGYLLYAHLQKGNDLEALDIVNQASSIVGPYSNLNRLVMAAHLTGMPIRYALERHEWEEATQIELRPAPDFPWEETSPSFNVALCPPSLNNSNSGYVWTGGYTQFDALTHFVHTIGHARLGNVNQAKSSLDSLRSIINGIGSQGTACTIIWDEQLLEMSADAWVDYAMGNHESALTKLKEATEYSITAISLGPGELWPTGEQLADMYLEEDRYQDALNAYRAVLDRLPNRHNSIYGVARSAELLDNLEIANNYYKKLLEVSASNSKRETLQHARSFLASNF